MTRVIGKIQWLKWTLAILSVLLVVQGCQKPRQQSQEPIKLPWPDADQARYLQSHADSMQFQWYTDVKATASAFMNEWISSEVAVSTADVVVLSEGLFHARLEVHTPSKIFELTMERPFKERGTESIWQVTKMEAKNWPESKSK